MKKFPAASHLTDGEYKLLLRVYADHNSSMGPSDRKRHTLSDIEKVVRVTKNQCLHVYYNNGNWWRYYANGTWANSNGGRN